MRRVVVESPFRGKDEAEAKRNLEYARAAVRDCILRGEAPIASHLLLTQPGILDDAVPAERVRGIAAGHEWIAFAEAVVVYEDFGVSFGMGQGIARAQLDGIPVERRRLPAFTEPPAPVNEYGARPASAAALSGGE